MLPYREKPSQHILEALSAWDSTFLLGFHFFCPAGLPPCRAKPTWTQSPGRGPHRRWRSGGGIVPVQFLWEAEGPVALGWAG